MPDTLNSESRYKSREQEDKKITGSSLKTDMIRPSFSHYIKYT